MVSKGRVHEPGKLEGFVASGRGWQALGALTYCVDGNECEVVTLDITWEGMGAGSLYDA